MSAQPGAGFSERTAWARNIAAPIRSFLSTESGSAMVLLAATVVAMVWANSPWSDSYESVWETKLSIQLGGDGISLDLRHWINEGLMTLFFLVVGLEAKRELDLGALRDRQRLAIPALAALGGMGDGRPDLPPVQRGRPGGERLGGRDVDRHRVRARRPGPRGPRCRAAARARPDARDHRRPGGAADHRHRVQRRRRAAAAGPRRRAVRRADRASLRTRRVARARGGHPRRGGLGGALRVRRRPGDRRSGRGTRHERLPTAALGARARDRAHALVSRAAHARAGALGPARGDLRGLAERAPPVPAPPLDQLRDRAAVRARERGHRRRRGPAPRRADISDHARDRLRVRRGQARGGDRGRLACDTAAPRRPAAIAELARDRRRLGRWPASASRSRS